jgi:hypothetical protein
MNAMKKILAVAAILFVVGCTKVDVPTPQPPVVNAELKITSAVGIKLQSPFVTNEVAMNVKSDVAQSVTIKIFDISNRVVSKETVNVIVGDNILKVYTSALPPSAYRIGLFDANGNQLGINLNTQTIKLTGYNNFN